MATYTPNLNLGKPEATDAFSGFRQLFNDNMDILDNGGGGGSGGHTIVNENGTDMPAEGKLQFTGNVSVTDDSGNGKTVVDILGGGGNVYGAFIDTNRIITSGTYSVNFSYTATEDCFVYAVVPFNGNSGGQLQIDGETINGWWNGSSGTISESFVVPVKKGQTITATATNSSASTYIVYGMVQGTNGIFTPIIYSDTERVVGVWRDNKPLYAKTYHFTSGWVNDNWTDMTDLSGLNIDTFVKSNFSVSRTDNSLQYTGNGSIRPETSGQNHTISARYYSNHLQVMVNNYNDIVRLDITILYTKTTDVAGSGNWNTDGVPTVHYSTTEQVIGTWLDSKPIYRRTINFTTASSAVTVYNSGISDIKSIIKQDGFIDRGDGWYMPLNFSRWDSSPSDLIGTMIKNDGTVNVFINDAFYYGKDVYVTLDYTKTTD